MKMPQSWWDPTLSGSLVPSPHQVDHALRSAFSARQKPLARVLRSSPHLVGLLRSSVSVVLLPSQWSFEDMAGREVDIAPGQRVRAMQRVETFLGHSGRPDGGVQWMEGLS